MGGHIAWEEAQNRGGGHAIWKIMGMGVRFGGVGFGGRSQDLGGSKWEKESHELGGLRGGGLRLGA